MAKILTSLEYFVRKPFPQFNQKIIDTVGNDPIRIQIENAKCEIMRYWFIDSERLIWIEVMKWNSSDWMQKHAEAY